MSTGDHKLDEFESLFRSAISDVFHYRKPSVTSVAVVSDLDETRTAAVAEAVKRWLGTVDGAEGAAVHVLAHDAWADGDTAAIPRLMEQLEAKQVDLVVTTRGLLGRTRALPFTLGSVADMLSQGQAAPLLLLPDLDPGAVPTGTERVLAVTNHLQGDDELVSWAVALTPHQGTLFLAHVEDDVTVERILEAIGRIREIDSDVARERLPAKLLELPLQYVTTIGRVLTERGIQENIVPIVQMGHALTDYRRLVEEHGVQLVVVSGRDDRQRAMHGLAHALSVELREQPVLVL